MINLLFSYDNEDTVCKRQDANTNFTVCIGY